MNDLKKVLDFFLEAKTFYLATVCGDKPAIRPLGAAMIKDDRLYIVTASNKAMFLQMQQNPAVELCGCIGMNWVRVCGQAYVDERKEARDEMLETNPVLKSIYGTNDDKGMVVLYLDNVNVEWH
jgi:uncharacterized pyridoxamine 5'-phosphate oxidase family protein